MFWKSVPGVPWAGPSPRGSGGGGGGGGGQARGANTRRRQLAPEPYSLGHLRVLFQRLIDAQEGRVEGETTVVETLRAISEVVVYGENQDAKLAARAAAKAQEEQEHEQEEAAAAAAAAAEETVADSATATGGNGSRGDGDSGGKSPTRPPAKGAEIDSGGCGEDGRGSGVAGRKGGGGDMVPPPVLKGLTVTDVRREDAFFELFCEKNMMSRFLELLRSPSSRYLHQSGTASSGVVNGKRTGESDSSSAAWGNNGGLDAVIRAITWGGDVLGRGQGTGATGGGAGGGGDGGERSSAELQVQVIQTTSILVMNVKSDTSLFYLLSNNHVNDMIMFDFRLEDEEVLSHFASFLKTLSLRLNENTVQFFLRGPRQKSQSQPPPPPATVAPKAPVTPPPTNGPRPESRAPPSVSRPEAGARAEVGGAVFGNDAEGTVVPAAAAAAGVDEEHEEEAATEEQEEQEEEEEEEGASFPLYTRALEYICHGDFHVRIAALTVVLNIYNQRDPLVRAYLNGPAARSASLPDRLVGALRSQCLVLADSAMAAGVGGDGGGGGGGDGGGGRAGAGGAAAVDPTICRDSIAGLQDQVFYLEDVFASGQRELNSQLCESLLNRLVRPMLLGDWLSGRSGAMFPQVALCAIAQLFIVVTHPPLVRLLVLETLGSGGSARGVGSGARSSSPAAAATTTSTTEVVLSEERGGVRGGPGMGSAAPLLALLQGDREELCLGALVVLQALAQNRVVRTDLGLAQGSADDAADDGFSANDDGPPDAAAPPPPPPSTTTTTTAATGAGDASMRPLGPEILDSAVDALCCMLAPSAAEVQAVEGEDRMHGGGGEEDAEEEGGSMGARAGEVGNEGVKEEGEGGEGGEGGPAEESNGGYGAVHSTVPPSIRVPSSRPRRHHLVLRLCGKVLASLAPPHPPPPVAADSPPAGGVGGSGGGATAGPQKEGQEPSSFPAEVSEGPQAVAAAAAPGGKVALGAPVHSGAGGGRANGDGQEGQAAAAPEEGRYSGEGAAGGSGRRDAVLRRIGAAHAAAAEVVLRGMGDAESASIVAFEEEIREWSKRVGLDGAITNLPKMSSLILRWSLDNTPPPHQSPPPRTPSPPRSRTSAGGGGNGGGGCAEMEAGGGRARQRELRSALQAFLEVRQVWRLLSGRGETDPSVLSIAGLGPEAEELPREDGCLDLGGRECLACTVSDTVERTGCGGGGAGGGGSGRKRRSGVAAAIAAASAAASRRGRSELYLVLDAKAFLLATPDRRRLMNGEIKSSVPLLHLAAAADPADKKRLLVRALSHRPVALMRPVTAPRASTPRSSGGGGGNGKKDGGNSQGAADGGGGEDDGGGDAGSMCDMQAWACELSFENERSCLLARKHMEGRRLRLRSEKMKCITDLLVACVNGRDD